MRVSTHTDYRNAGGRKQRFTFHIVTELPETQSLGPRCHINREERHWIQPAPPPLVISGEEKELLCFPQDLNGRNYTGCTQGICVVNWVKITSVSNKHNGKIMSLRNAVFHSSLNNYHYSLKFNYRMLN